MKPCAHNANVLPRRQRGVSLVEIMIAITVGLVLTAGVIQVFVSNKQAYRVQEGLARVQENGRFTLAFITRDVRGSGFLGCAGNATPIVNTLNDKTSLPWNFASPIQGFEAINPTTWWSTTASLPLDASIIVSAQGLTDVLTVRRSVGDPVPVVSPPGNPNRFHHHNRHRDGRTGCLQYPCKPDRDDLRLHQRRGFPDPQRPQPERHHRSR